MAVDWEDDDSRDAVAWRFSREGEGFCYALLDFYGSEAFEGTPVHAEMVAAERAIEAAVAALGRHGADPARYEL